MNRSTSLLESSRREALFVVVVWLSACLYTVGYATLFAYRVETTPTLILGMPAWVFWGIVVPWTVCTVLTCWYALCGMRDEDLGGDSAAAAEGDGNG
jgi:hypothetical protein